MKKVQPLLYLLMLMLTGAVCKAQTYTVDWNGSFSPAWANGTTSRTQNNIGGSGVNITVGIVNTVTSSWENNTPAVGNPGSIGWALPTPTGTGSLVLWADWTNTQQRVTATFTFLTPVANISFLAGDIDKADATVDNNDNYLDRITVTGTTPGGATLNAVASKYNAASTIINVAGNAAWANNIAGQGGNAATNSSTGAAQDGTALFTINGTVSSVTLIWDNFNNANTGVNPTGQAVNLGDISFTKTLAVSGTVYNDVDGSQTINGSEAGFLPTTLYVNAVDVNTGRVIGVATVAANGSYSFPNLASNSSVSLVLSTTASTLGSTTAPTPATIAGYASTSPFTLPVTTATANITGQNFGIDRLPVPAVTTTAPQTNPGGSNTFLVPAASFGATDPDGGTIGSIRITQFPSNCTSIVINGVSYTTGTFPVAGVVIPTNTSGVPNWPIRIDPVDGLVSPVITYRATDNAGKESTANGTVTVPFSSTLPLRIISFDAVPGAGNVNLYWRTANELNVASINLEKSTDGISFVQVGQFAAYNDDAAHSYQFTTVQDAAVIYWRLRIVDMDGSVRYSVVITSKTGEARLANAVLSYPNPIVGETFQLSYRSHSYMQVAARWLNADGKQLSRSQVLVMPGVNQLSLPVPVSVTRGLYFIALNDGANEQIILRVVRN